MVELNEETKNKLEYVLSNVNKIPEKEFIGNIVPILNKVEYDSYEWDADFVGITRDGKIGYVFDSGCSCNEPEWEPENGAIPEQKDIKHDTTVKGFEMTIKDVGNYCNCFDLEEINKNLDRLQKQI